MKSVGPPRHNERCATVYDTDNDCTCDLGRLYAALDEALEQWGYAAGYKGDYLRQKHGDVEQIETIRALLATSQEAQA